MATKHKITYCLWFEKDVEEAVNFYTSVFKNSEATDVMHNPLDTPSGKTGTVLTMGFDLEGQRFMILNGGTKVKPNPSISFMVHCDTADEVESLWNKLFDGGKALMPLDKYPFSDRYGWIEDKYGVSWQLILPQKEAPQKVMPSMMFVREVCGRAQEAINYYTSIFPHSQTGTIARYPAGSEPDKEDTIMYADFMLAGEWFVAMDSAWEHNFNFNENISFIVHCDSQEEIDNYWTKLTNGGREVQCGWLRDKFGIAWQITPDILLELINGKDKERARRVMLAMMKMVKLDIAAIERA